VLAFARDEELSPRETDVAGLLRAAADHAGADPVEVVTPAGAAAWRLDPERMDQVLINLLINARQASPAGEPVTLAAAIRGTRLALEVSDRGPGFDPGIVETVFEPFQTGRLHGTGLGLHLARRIVERHGGTIAAGNREGGGAVVRIELPAGGEGGAP
jgi:signal transduction histidine kinase